MFGWFRKNSRILEFFLLCIEINIVMSTCMQKLQTCLLYNPNDLGSIVILRKQEGFFAKQPNHRLSATRPIFPLGCGERSAGEWTLTILTRTYGTLCVPYHIFYFLAVCRRINLGMINLERLNLTFVHNSTGYPRHTTHIYMTKKLIHRSKFETKSNYYSC